MFFILGPCVIESEDHAVRMAARIKRVCAEAGVEFVFKASFDKANRTSAGAFRGPGLVEGLRILGEVKAETGVRLTTDIHEPAQAEPTARVVDILQIPALLSRQTDLIVAAARTGRPLNIKKGQFMSPDDMFYAGEKAWMAGAREIWLTERGTTFGYHDLVVDMRSIPTMRALGFPVIIDATHSVQRPGGGRGSSTGRPDLIPTIAKAAVAAGADGVFLEVHDDPARAKSDGPNSLPLADLASLLRVLTRLHEAVR
jgi:2-dehydro-3-deoxyphosphooctonate aldolase (KDO 8-P synthase)